MERITSTDVFLHEYEETSRVMKESEVNLMDVSRRSGIGYTTLREIKYMRANPTVEMLTKVNRALWERKTDGTTCENCRWCESFKAKRVMPVGCWLGRGWSDETAACSMYNPGPNPND